MRILDFTVSIPSDTSAAVVERDAEAILRLVWPSNRGMTQRLLHENPVIVAIEQN